MLLGVCFAFSLNGLVLNAQDPQTESEKSATGRIYESDFSSDIPATVNRPPRTTVQNSAAGSETLQPGNRQTPTVELNRVQPKPSELPVKSGEDLKPVDRNELTGKEFSDGVNAELNSGSDKSGLSGNSTEESLAKGDAENSESKNEEVDGQDEKQTSVWDLGGLTDRKSIGSRIQMILSVATISLVPAILLMTTCFIRIVVVLGILRQAIGLQQLPPTQVTTALALMMTFLIMTPTWKQVKNDAIDPYTAENSTMTWDEAWSAGVNPIKKFMWNQVRAAENEEDFWLFWDHLDDQQKSTEPESFEDIPLQVMMPAFMISELKVAFLIGAQLFLPFLILDIVVASFSNTMGLMMLPPTVVSLPLKLILFVMVDGWNLVVGLLLNSFQAFA